MTNSNRFQRLLIGIWVALALNVGLLVYLSTLVGSTLKEYETLQAEVDRLKREVSVNRR